MTSALPLTLKSISSTKLEELSKQRALFDQRKSEILQAANAATGDSTGGSSTGLRRKVQILLEGVTRLAGRPEDAFDREDDVDLDHVAGSSTAASIPLSPEDYTPSDWKRSRDINIRRFLFQSNYDSSVSDDVLRGWISSLEDDLKFLSVKYEHATFYSGMVTEWLSNFEDGGKVGNGNAAVDNDSDDTNSNKSSFQEVGRAEMHEQRDTWESLVFSPADVDPQSIETYLDRLFNRTKLSKQALRELRERIKRFGSTTMRSEANDSFDIEVLKTVSKSLLSSDLLSPEKVMILKEFLRNDEVAEEVVDVLNLRFAALDRWSWPAEGVPVEMRRQLNGKYRVYMDEDLIDAILFHYIGLKWSITFRDAFINFLESPAWKSNSMPIPKAEVDRRRYFLGNTVGSGASVDNLRMSMYKRDYFMSQLPASLSEGQRGYDDGIDGDNNYNEDAEDRRSPIETKHSLLHLLITESIIHNRLRGQFTVIRSDFKWFGPSLPHDTLLAVLKFFGVPSDWLEIFRKYLECPLMFAQDGPEGAVRTRRRGIPISHSLSDAFGESILFCMDYAVNQQADGAFLYRLHDDFWFWGEEKTCRKAWRAMTDFTAVTGLEFNEEKTGTARIGKRVITPNPGGRKRRQQHDDSDSSFSDEEVKEEGSSGSEDDAEIDNGFDPLPRGDIRWGFLRLDAERGRFLIDQEQVDAHIEELRHQLSACTSIFSWVQAWNSYFSRFFSNNFAKPSVAFGREHIDMAINTLSRIERQVFAHAASKAAGNGGVVDHLRRVIANRFDIRDLPDGFFFFPIEFGGLELHNPFINFLSMRENITQTPQRLMEKVYLDEAARYETAKKKWEKGEVNGFSSYRRTKQKDYDDDDKVSPEAFLTFEEYTAYLESTSSALQSAYNDLLRVPEETSVGPSAELNSRDMLPDVSRGRGGGWRGSGGGRGRGRGRGGAFFPGPRQQQQQGNDRIVSDWSGMTPYWKWVAEAYRTGMVQKYGGLSAVDRALMPLGVVKVLRQGKVRWQA